MSKYTSKYTRWFPPEIDPVHIGPFQRDYGFSRRIYNYWDGEHWGTAQWTPKAAAQTRSCLSGFRKPWRGLARKPK